MYNQNLYQGYHYHIPSWYYANSYPSHIHYYSPYTRQFPPVDPTKFQQSANKASQQLTDAKKIIDRISGSPEFAHRLMGAAQLSQKNEVRRLVASIGLKTVPGIDYTPDGLLLTFTNKQSNVECCKIRINMRWT